MKEEEKVVKTPRKKTTKVPAEEKKTKVVKETKTKNSTTKKSTTKKNTVPKSEIKKSVAKKSTKAKVVEEVKKEVPKTKSVKVTKEVVKETKPVKKTTKTAAKKPAVSKKKEKEVTPKTEPTGIKPEDDKVVNATVDQELIKARTIRQTIEVIVLSLLFFIILLLLLNKTFVRTNYSNDKISIDIPRFMYYVSDENNTITLKTLRKSENVREFFDEYLEELVYYNCSETGYYDDETKTFIKSITVEKNFAFKTVKIEYSTKVLSEICS